MSKKNDKAVKETVKAFERPLDRMIANADHAMKILNLLSGGKLKEKYEKKTDKRR